MDKKNELVLIGLGNIGYRHFQSLMNLDIITHLTIIDVDDSALEKARQYENDIQNEKVSITYQKDISILPKEIDILIIATSSLARYKIFEEVTERSKVKYIIFEKFLFPREEEYHQAKKRLEENNIKAYVNTPSRLYPGYIKLKEQLGNQKHIDVLVSGSDWGLSCNVIHTIDVIAFLMNSYAPLISDGTSLDDIILQSKRKNYIEFTGRMICVLGNVANIILDSYSTGENVFRTTIYRDEAVYTISETEQWIKISHNGETRTEKFPIYYQSQLTASVVESLINTGECGLSLYKDSMIWHLSLLKEFIKKYSEVTGQNQVMCPMT